MGTTADKLNKILESKAAIKAAIEAKGVSNVGDILSAYPEKIASISSGSGFTGHADVEGLKAIGWTDEDIEYFQKYGINWNEEDDDLHKVPQENIDLYGVLTADNIQEYKDIIRYLPKIDTSKKTTIDKLCQGLRSLVAIPILDTSNVGLMQYAFDGCVSLIYVPPLNTSKVETFSNTFFRCYSLIHVDYLDLSKCRKVNSMFYQCYNLKTCKLNTINCTINTQVFTNCHSLINVYDVDLLNNTTNINAYFSNCYCLTNVRIKNLNKNLEIKYSSLLSKESIIYMIQNAAPTEAIIITLNAYVYDKYAEDAEVKAALEAQPLISLAKA